MPIKYGTTTVNTVKYGSTTVGTVYYGSTRVFPSAVTIGVSNTDTSYGVPFISTDPQATSGSTSLTVPAGTTVYFFMQIRLSVGTFPYNLRANTWTYISGGQSIFDHWSYGAVFRLGENSCVYTSAINAAYNGYTRLGTNGAYVANESKDFQIQARTLNCGYYGEVSDMIRWDEDYEYEDYSTIFLRNDYTSISVPKATVYGDYYYYMNSTGSEFEDWDFTEGYFPSNNVYFLFRDIYYEGDMSLEFTIYDEDKNYNPVYVSLILDHSA